MKKTVLLIAIIFVCVLGASLGILLYMSPDFSGFGSKPLSEPVVTYLSSDSDEETGSGGEDRTPYNWEEHPIFIVGDSLTHGARSEISKAVGDGATIDGKDSRNMSAGVSILRDWQESGALTDDAIIVVCLAHNITDSTVKDAQKIVEMIKPGQSLIMMTGHGRSNMAPINEYIRSLPNVYSYITVADWDLTIAQSPSLLSDDGIHINRKQGNELYASLILRALEWTQPMP